jgi:hypothetical protein
MRIQKTICCCFLIGSFISVAFAQSKKEQIAESAARIDSLQSRLIELGAEYNALSKALRESSTQLSACTKDRDEVIAYCRFVYDSLERAIQLKSGKWQAEVADLRSQLEIPTTWHEIRHRWMLWKEDPFVDDLSANPQANMARSFASRDEYETLQRYFTSNAKKFKPIYSGRLVGKNPKEAFPVHAFVCSTDEGELMACVVLTPAYFIVHYGTQFEGDQMIEYGDVIPVSSFQEIDPDESGRYSLLAITFNDFPDTYLYYSRSGFVLTREDWIEDAWYSVEDGAIYTSSSLFFDEEAIINYLLEDHGLVVESLVPDPEGFGLDLTSSCKVSRGPEGWNEWNCSDSVNGTAGYGQ